MTPAELRGLVPAAEQQVYLDTATYGPAAGPTADAVRAFTEEWSHGVERFETWDGYTGECRALFAGLLGAAEADIAIQPYVSTAAGTLAVQLPAGSRVVVGEMEFGSNLWPWLHQRERGVEVALVPAPGGRPELAGYREAAAGGVTILAVSAMQSSNGWRAPLPDLAEIAHRGGGLLFVDACQGAGAIRLEPGRHGFDALATDSYKWLMGPRGSGYLYLSPAARDRFRPVLVGPHAGAQRLGGYYGPGMRLAGDAAGYDSSPSWIAAAADRVALRLLGEVGIGVIEAHDLRLADRFREGLRRAGVGFADFPPSESSPIVSVNLGDPDQAVARLARSGVVAASRGGAVRFSFHAFNDDQDVDAALEALR